MERPNFRLGIKFIKRIKQFIVDMRSGSAGQHGAVSSEEYYAAMSYRHRFNHGFDAAARPAVVLHGLTGDALEHALLSAAQGVHYSDSDGKICIFDAEEVKRLSAKLIAFPERFEEHGMDGTLMNNIHMLSDREKAHLFALLVSVPFAEYTQDLGNEQDELIRKINLINSFYERTIQFKDEIQKEGLPSSYFAWQLPTPRIPELLARGSPFGIPTPQEAVPTGKDGTLTGKDLETAFYKHLTMERAAVVACRILFHIGLVDVHGKKEWLEARETFIRYNQAGRYCTEMAAFQLFLNGLRVMVETKKGGTVLSLEFIVSALNIPELTDALQRRKTNPNKWLNPLLDAIERECKTFNKSASAIDTDALLREWPKLHIDGSFTFKEPKHSDTIVLGDVGKAIAAASKVFTSLQICTGRLVEGEKTMASHITSIIGHAHYWTDLRASKKALADQLMVLEKVLTANESLHEGIVGALKLGDAHANAALARHKFRLNCFGNPKDTRAYASGGMECYTYIMNHFQFSPTSVTS